MILTFTPIFFDERYVDLRSKDLDALLAHLATLCVRSIGQPDAGLWEIRNGWQEHSFTNLMSWAGLERLERIKQAGHLASISLDLTSARIRAAEALLRSVHDGAVRNGPSDLSYDAALAQLPILGYPNRQLSESTVLRIAQELAFRHGSDDSGFFYRYVREDDFGKPEGAFVICSFWIAQHLPGWDGSLKPGRSSIECSSQPIMSDYSPSISSPPRISNAVISRKPTLTSVSSMPPLPSVLPGATYSNLSWPMALHDVQPSAPLGWPLSYQWKE